MAAERFDAIVIGTGQAGKPLALDLAGAGAAAPGPGGRPVPRQRFDHGAGRGAGAPRGARRRLHRAGPEIGVTSTKAFTTQLTALYLLGLHLRQLRGGDLRPARLQDLARLPAALTRTLAAEPALERLAGGGRQRRAFPRAGLGSGA